MIVYFYVVYSSYKVDKYKHAPLKKKAQIKEFSRTQQIA